MKKVFSILIVLLAACGDDFTGPESQDDGGGGEGGAPPPACEVNVTGRITVRNTSSQVQQVVLNGVNHGSVNTGSSLDVDLPPGPYTLEIQHLDGSAACQAATINISKCSTQTLQCEG